MQLFDFQSNRSVSGNKTSVTRIENPITLDDAARHVGLPTVMGRKIGILSERQALAGKIAKVSPQVSVSRWGSSVVWLSDKRYPYFAAKGISSILIPGRSWPVNERELPSLRFRRSIRMFPRPDSLAILRSNLKSVTKSSRRGGKLIVAVCPLSNDDGSSNPTGNSLAEELVSALVQRKVSVVERSALDMVLSELIAQNTILFDQKSAQQLGKLTGASMVLTGKIIQEKSAGKAHLRLIDVRTEEILLAVSAPVKFTARSSTSTSSTGSRPGAPGSSSKKEVVSKPSGELEYLGKSKSLPRYLTTTAALERTPEDGVRFLGFPKHYAFEAGIIVTRERNFLDRNFIFEVLVTFGPNDGAAHIGIGAGRQDGSANRRAESVFISFHTPHHGDGGFSLQGSERPEVTFGNVRQNGVHLVRMTKEGDSLAIEVDHENDGPSDDDFETVSPDLREYAPYLNSKNSTLFLGGTGTIVATRLKIIP
ncbi:MAG: hypothetical protein DWI29_00645 [Planctomycetota bacterium]|nr:MAG: hypothetical protein DWI29_00645 [Planctomycetota bacterium]